MGGGEGVEGGGVLPHVHLERAWGDRGEIWASFEAGQGLGIRLDLELELELGARSR